MGDVRIELVNDILSYISFLACFIMIFPSAHTEKKNYIQVVILSGAVGAGYLWLGGNYPVRGYRLAAVPCLAVLGILSCFRNAVYRGGRLWFTVLSIGAAETAVRFFTESAVVLMKGKAPLKICLNFLLLLVIGIFFHKIREKYRDILEVDGVNWSGLTLRVGFIFFIFCMLGMIQVWDYGPGGLILAAGLAAIVLMWYCTLLENVWFEGELSRSNAMADELKEFKRIAYIDELTGLKNRRALDEDLERLKTEKSPFTYIVFDINDLKEVNDTYGHMMGDAFICRAAEVLREAGSGSIGIYRTGGDEFVLLFSGCTEDTERLYRETMLQMSSGFFRCGSKVYGMAAGFGKMNDYVNDSVDTVMRRSDMEMYRNKSKMKNADAGK
ncbi:GGDEF domain-containing protein [Blautia schinkii]|nr:GGDEF domain-containing protein [Blautia schinkii]